MAEITKDAAGNTAFDLRRQKIDTKEAADRKLRLGAVNRQLSSQGLSDSGIVNAERRVANADVSNRAAGERGNINIAELESRGNIDEAERQRVFQGKEAALTRSLQSDLTKSSLATTERGQDIGAKTALGSQNVQLEGIQAGERVATAQQAQDAKIAADRLGLDTLQVTNQNAQAIAGLNQAFTLADRGLNLQQSAQELTKLQISNDLAVDMASLAQAKLLAEQGLDIQRISQELQRDGMAQQDAQYYASLTQDKDLMQQELDSQIKKLFIGEAVAGLNPDSVEFQQTLSDFAALLDAGLPDFAATAGISAEEAKTLTPEQKLNLINQTGFFGGAG